MTKELYTLEVLRVTDLCFVDKEHKYHVTNPDFKLNSTDRIYSVTELLGKVDFSSAELSAACEVGVELHKAFETRLMDTCNEYIDYLDGDEYTLPGDAKLRLLTDKAREPGRMELAYNPDPRKTEITTALCKKLDAAISDIYRDCFVCKPGASFTIERPLVAEVAVRRGGQECARIFIGGTADFACETEFACGQPITAVVDVKTAINATMTNAWRLQLAIYAWMYRKYFGSTRSGRLYGIVITPDSSPEYLVAFTTPDFSLDYDIGEQLERLTHLWGEIVVNRFLEDGPKKLDVTCADYVSALRELKAAVDDINREYNTRIRTLEAEKKKEIDLIEDSATDLVLALKKKQAELQVNEVPEGQFFIEEKTRVRTAIDLEKVQRLGIIGSSLYSTTIQKVETMVRFVAVDGREEVIFKLCLGGDDE